MLESQRPTCPRLRHSRRGTHPYPVLQRTAAIWTVNKMHPVVEEVIGPERG